MTLEHVLILGLILFAIGAVGFFIRSNTIVLLLCIELMLNAVNLILCGFSRYLYGTEGQIFILIVMTVAAAETATGLAILLALYRLFKTTDMNRINSLKG
jgi:NADH-quinone oxidoreductase subunit K